MVSIMSATVIVLDNIDLLVSYPETTSPVVVILTTTVTSSPTNCPTPGTCPLYNKFDVTF